MKDFILELIAAVGGALGMTLIFLRFSKGIIQKWVETTIQTTAKKSLSKYSNTLERRTKAYEMLLEKEFAFYESASSFTSDLVVNIQDFSYYLGISNDHPGEANLAQAKEVGLAIMRSVPEFKRDVLLTETYIPDEIREASTKLLHDLQEYIPFMYEALKSSVDDILDSESIKKITDNEKETLMNCALLSTRIKMRLEKLSEE